MKVLFFCNLVPRKQGSFEDVLSALGWEFKEHGDELVLVLGGEPIPQVAESFLDAGLRWHVISGWTTELDEVNAWAFFAPAVEQLVEERPDVAVVHFGNELPSLVACIVARLKGVRARWVWQQDQQISAPGALTSFASRIKLLSMAFDRFVAVYEGGRQSMILRGIPNRKITVVNNSTGTPSLRRTPRQVRNDLRVPENAVIAVAVASLIPRKRVDFMIRGFATAKTDAENAMLLVIGDGAERQSLESLVSELELGETVRFLGLRNDVEEILSAGDIFVHSAIAEACSYAILESMASEIPAVVTESGAAREQILDGKTGYVLSRDDMDGFASRLTELLQDEALRKRMGEQARARWQECYRVDLASKKYHALYRSMVRSD